MSWIADIIKDIPQVAVLKERLTLQDEKFALSQKEKDETILSLQAQIASLQADNERLSLDLEKTTLENGMLKQTQQHSSQQEHSPIFTKESVHGW